MRWRWVRRLICVWGIEALSANGQAVGLSIRRCWVQIPPTLLRASAVRVWPVYGLQTNIEPKGNNVKTRKNRSDLNEKLLLLNNVVHHIFAIKASDYEQYGLNVDPVDKVSVPAFAMSFSGPHPTGLVSNESHYKAQREALIKRIKRKMAKSGDEHVLVSFDGVTGRNPLYYVKRNISKPLVDKLTAVSDDNGGFRVSLISWHAAQQLDEKYSDHERSLFKLGQRMKVRKAIMAMRELHEKRSWDYGEPSCFRVPIGQWHTIPHFDELGLVRQIDCACMDESTDDLNSDCPLCEKRGMENMIEVIEEFIASPSHSYERSDSEKRDLGTKYGLLDLMTFESNMCSGFGAGWDVVNGKYHSSQWDIVYRVESTWRGGQAVELDEIKAYLEQLKKDVPLADKNIADFKIEDHPYLNR